MQLVLICDLMLLNPLHFFGHLRSSLFFISCILLLNTTHLLVSLMPHVLFISHILLLGQSTHLFIGSLSGSSCFLEPFIALCHMCP